MSVHREGGTRARWRVRWREAGRNRNRTFDRKADADAFDARQRRQRQFHGADEILLDDVTFEEYAAEWFETHVEANLAPRTVTSYAHALDVRLIPSFGGIPLRQIRPAMVERWIAELRREGVGDPSILRACAVFSAIMRRAQINGVILGNPVSPVRKPRQRASRSVAPIPPATIERIRAQLRPRDALLVSLLAYAGLRPESEALPLTWGDIGGQTINVRATKTGTTRHVRLLRPLDHDLAAWREVSDDRPRSLVVPRESGEPWTEGAWRNWRRRYWKPAATAAGLPDSRPRDLRASFASLLIAEGRTVVETAAELGHSAETCLHAYARAFAEYDPAKRISAEEEIVAARLMFHTSSTSGSPNTPLRPAPARKEAD